MDETINVEKEMEEAETCQPNTETPTTTNTEESEDSKSEKTSNNKKNQQSSVPNESEKPMNGEVIQSIPKFDPVEKIYLEHEWAFWFDSGKIRGMNQHSYENSLKIIGAFRTVQDFWRYWNNFTDINKFPEGSNLLLFKLGIKPMWEDPANEKGGKWVINVDKRHIFESWLKIVLFGIGEQFSSGDQLCGMVLSVRSRGDTIKVWNRSADNLEETQKMSDDIRRCLSIPQHVHLGYQMHMGPMEHNKQIISNKQHRRRGSRENSRKKSWEKSSSFNDDHDRLVKSMDANTLSKTLDEDLRQRTSPRFPEKKAGILLTKSIAGEHSPSEKKVRATKSQGSSIETRPKSSTLPSSPVRGTNQPCVPVITTTEPQLDRAFSETNGNLSPQSSSINGTPSGSLANSVDLGDEVDFPIHLTQTFDPQLSQAKEDEISSQFSQEFDSEDQNNSQGLSQPESNNTHEIEHNKETTPPQDSQSLSPRVSSPRLETVSSPSSPSPRVETSSSPSLSPSLSPNIVSPQVSSPSLQSPSPSPSPSPSVTLVPPSSFTLTSPNPLTDGLSASWGDMMVQEDVHRGPILEPDRPKDRKNTNERSNNVRLNTDDWRRPRDTGARNGGLTDSVDHNDRRMWRGKERSEWGQRSHKKSSSFAHSSRDEPENSTRERAENVLTTGAARSHKKSSSSESLGGKRNPPNSGPSAPGQRERGGTLESARRGQPPRRIVTVGNGTRPSPTTRKNSSSSLTNETIPTILTRSSSTTSASVMRVPKTSTVNSSTTFAEAVTKSHRRSTSSPLSEESSSTVVSNTNSSPTDSSAHTLQKESPRTTLYGAQTSAPKVRSGSHSSKTTSDVPTIQPIHDTQSSLQANLTTASAPSHLASPASVNSAGSLTVNNSTPQPLAQVVDSVPPTVSQSISSTSSNPEMSQGTLAVVAPTSSAPSVSPAPKSSSNVPNQKTKESNNQRRSNHYAHGGTRVYKEKERKEYKQVQSKENTAPNASPFGSSNQNIQKSQNKTINSIEKRNSLVDEKGQKKGEKASIPPQKAPVEKNIKENSSNLPSSATFQKFQHEKHKEAHQKQPQEKPKELLQKVSQEKPKEPDMVTLAEQPKELKVEEIKQEVVEEKVTELQSPSEKENQEPVNVEPQSNPEEREIEISEYDKHLEEERKKKEQNQQVKGKRGGGSQQQKGKPTATTTKNPQSNPSKKDGKKQGSGYGKGSHKGKHLESTVIQQSSFVHTNRMTIIVGAVLVFSLSVLVVIYMV